MTLQRRLTSRPYKSAFVGATRESPFILCAWLFTPLLILLLITASGTFAQEPARDPNGNASADLQLETLQAEIESLRGITPETPIDRFYITPTEWQAFTLDTLTAQYSEDQALTMAWFYYAFHFVEGVMPAAAPEIAPAPADFYDFQRDHLYVVNNNQAITGLRGLFYVAAYTQALVEQNYDVGSLFTEYPFLTDQGLAIRAVVHGDALFTQQQYLDQVLANDPAVGFTLLRSAVSLPQDRINANVYEQAAERFTFEQGQVFVQYLYNTGGWAMVNDLYDNLPVSMEQVLHPLRYLDGELPQSVDIASLDDQTPIHSGTMGEFGLRQHLSVQLEPAQAYLMAEGWGGDAFHLYTEDTAYTLIWRIAWDTARDAAEFNDTYPLYLERQLGVPGFQQEGTRLVCWNSTPAACILRGDQTSVIAYADSIDAAQALIAGQPEVK